MGGEVSRLGALFSAWGWARVPVSFSLPPPSYITWNQAFCTPKHVGICIGLGGSKMIHAYQMHVRNRARKRASHKRLEALIKERTWVGYVSNKRRWRMYNVALETKEIRDWGICRACEHYHKEIPRGVLFPKFQDPKIRFPPKTKPKKNSIIPSSNHPSIQNKCQPKKSMHLILKQTLCSPWRICHSLSLLSI